MSGHKWCFRFGTLLGLLIAAAVCQQLAARQALAADEPKLKFEVYKDAGGDFRWRLKAGNGEILATSGQGYKAKADCMNGINRIKEDVAGDKLKFETYEDNAKQTRWRLHASNGQVIATSSSGYKAKADCDHAIDSIKKGAAKAEVAEVDK